MGVCIASISPTAPPRVVIDYAHTPDALDNALLTLKHLTAGRLGVVFGCGGDRDQGKRAEMGKIATTHADKIFITDDNPRNENPESIRAEILTTCPQARKYRQPRPSDSSWGEMAQKWRHVADCWQGA